MPKKDSPRVVSTIACVIMYDLVCEGGGDGGGGLGGGGEGGGEGGGGDGGGDGGGGHGGGDGERAWLGRRRRQGSGSGPC